MLAWLSPSCAKMIVQWPTATAMRFPRLEPQCGLVTAKEGNRPVVFQGSTDICTMETALSRGCTLFLWLTSLRSSTLSIHVSSHLNSISIRFYPCACLCDFSRPSRHPSFTTSSLEGMEAETPAQRCISSSIYSWARSDVYRARGNTWR